MRNYLESEVSRSWGYLNYSLKKLSTNSEENHVKTKPKYFTSQARPDSNTSHVKLKTVAALSQLHPFTQCCVVVFHGFVKTEKAV